MRTIALKLLVAIYICMCIFIPVSIADAAQDNALIELPQDLEPGSEIVCIAASLNLRETPTTTEDNIIAVLKNGDMLIFLGFEGKNWVHVQTSDAEVGYCSVRYVRYSPIPTDTPVPADIVSADTTAAPEVTLKLAPPASGIYTDSWTSKSALQKLASLPYWLYFVIGAGLVFIVLQRLITSKRK